MINRNKKGVTLVELVICCAIIVMLGGACTALLMSGNTIYNRSSASANAQLDADVLQTYMLNILPRCNKLATDHLEGSEVNCIYFNEDGKFCLERSGSVTTITAISKLEYEVVQAGNSDTSRAQLVYTVTLDDGSTFTSGFVLANLPYGKSLVDTADEAQEPLKGTIAYDANAATQTHLYFGISSPDDTEPA